jgi:RNA polymerase sigma-70 factor (ECF subfamily)
MTDSEFRTAFEQHKDAVYRFGWRMSGSEAAAEDIAQEVFLVLLEQPERFDAARGPLRSFLLGIARNLALKKWREQNRWAELEGEEIEAVAPVASPDTSEAVGAAVRALPLLQREALILAEYEGMSLEEIARTVEAEVGTVKARLHRARENLRRALAPLRREKTSRAGEPWSR